MELYKINTLGLIQSFIKTTASKSSVFELNRNNLIYFIYRDIAENNTKVVIIKEDWIPLEKRVEWIRNYLLLKKDIRINRRSINDWIKVNEVAEETLDLSVIDLSIENKEDFKTLLNEPSKNKKIKFIIENHLNDKYTISQKTKVKMEDTYRKVIDRGLFNKNQSKKIGVISPFTYGKSALINSLLQLDLLQEDILVKTAKITTVTHDKNYWLMKEKPMFFLEKYTDESSFKERLKYLSTLNEKGSHLVNTTINNTQLKHITFVDTPGLFGKFPEHDEITEDMIKDLDYIMYLLNPTQLGFEPYTKRIIEWQQKYQKPCIFVMNKMDLVSTLEDRNKLHMEFNNTLSQKVKHDEVFYVSAYSALKARLYKKGKIDLLSLKRDPLIYVIEEDWVVNGRSFNEEHVDILEKASGVLKLEKYIKSIV
jgi:small GTP-binding protein